MFISSLKINLNLKIYYTLDYAFYCSLKLFLDINTWESVVFDEQSNKKII